MWYAFNVYWKMSAMCNLYKNRFLDIHILPFPYFLLVKTHAIGILNDELNGHLGGNNF